VNITDPPKATRASRVFKVGRIRSLVGRYSDEEGISTIFGRNTSVTMHARPRRYRPLKSRK
jgi:hypothetical protein